MNSRRKYSLDEFEEALASVILPEDEIVFVFSGLWSFANFLDVPVRESPRLVLDSIRNVVSGRRTLIMPAYNWSFCSTRSFDVRETPSEVGVISELFRKMPGVARTFSPINSHCVTGPRSAELTAIRNKTLWGDASEYGRFDSLNIRFVRVGSGEWNLGYLHRIEEAALVPYRYFKTFKGTRLDGTQQLEVEETMYVHYLDAKIQNEWSGWEAEMRSRNLFVIPENPIFKIESARARDVLNTGLELVGEDPYFFLKNKVEVRQWVEKNLQTREVI